jgi:hypothetical protein
MMPSQLIQLEWRLIRRNRRAWTILLLGILMPLPLLFIAPAVYALSPVPTSLLALAFTSGALLTYGTYLIAWEGSFFPRLMTLPISLRAYLQAKAWLLFMMCSLQTLIALLISAAFLGNSVTALLGGAFLYNLGINLPITIFMGQFNLKKINLATSSVIFTEQSGGNILLGLAVFGPAMLLAFLVDLYSGHTAIPLAFAGAGLLGLALQFPMFKYLARRFERQRYVLLNAYRQT